MNLNELEHRISMGETLLLDGAVGTQLQRLGVPMDNTAWAAAAARGTASLGGGEIRFWARFFLSS